MSDIIWVFDPIFEAVPQRARPLFGSRDGEDWDGGGGEAGARREVGDEMRWGEEMEEGGGPK